VQVSADGSTNWTTVASVSGLTYQYNNGVIESVTTAFTNQTGMKGLRIKVNNANNTWNHFSVQELEVLSGPLSR
jgi:hypothetical protein